MQEIRRPLTHSDAHKCERVAIATYQDVLPAVRLIQSIELAYIVLIIQRRDDENRRVKELFHVCNCKTIRCNMEYDNLINIDRRDI